MNVEHLELGALVGLREYLMSRGVDPDSTPGVSITRDAKGFLQVELPPDLAHHLDDFLEHKRTRSIYN